ncbi:family 78 glycoside hydrolase catalytic domain [Arthrobacter sp. D2-10]
MKFFVPYSAPGGVLFRQSVWRVLSLRGSVARKRRYRRGQGVRAVVMALVLGMLVVFFPAVGVAPTAVGAPAQASVSGLTVEHRTEPLGIDQARPRFGWQISSSTRGQRQSAYQVLVATDPKKLTPSAANMWNSGQVASASSVAVRYAGTNLEPSTRYFWTVRVWDKDGKLLPQAPAASFETSLLSSDGVTNWSGARWISMAGKAPNSPGAPMLRHQFTLTGKTVQQARLYISALGAYDAYLNGQRIGVMQDGAKTLELLAPGWTNYDTTTNYMSYDVTKELGSGPQATLGAVLGNGWYNSRVSDQSKYYSKDGNPLALKAKLVISYSDGSQQTVVTKPDAGWKATDSGPYRADDVYDGQTYDARQDLPGWAANNYDTAGWSEVSEHGFASQFPASKLVAYPGETARLMSKWDRDPQSVTVYTGVAGEDTSTNGKGQIVTDPARTVTDPAGAATAEVTLHPGDTAIYDFGQNMVGVPQYTVSGPEGTQISLLPGEMLNDQSAGADGPAGSVYRANLRSAKATSTYTLHGAGGEETHQDSLSFYGFRYIAVRITDGTGPVTIHNLTGKVATSAINETGEITTDNALVNQLYSNIRWGQRGNYLWVPTDCPQRDERQGWTGDTQVFAHTGLYNVDAVNFLSHFQDTLIESQQTYGVDGAQYPMTAPGGAFSLPANVSGWADAGVVVPWTLWQMSGDTTVIDRSWTSMTKYVDWITSRTGATYAGQGAFWGDWLAPQTTATEFMSDVYYAYSTKLLTEMAHATGRNAEARKYQQLFDNIKRTFILKYVSTDPLTGKVTVRSGLGTPPVPEPLLGGSPKTPENNTQTGLLWVLKLGLYETETQRRQIVNLLADNIGNSAAFKEAHPTSERTKYAEDTLSVGFLGVNVLAPVLTDQGRPDLAYKLLHQDAMPSWMYSVKNGATTIWERWNSYSTDDGFGPVAMNSFNHYAYGAIGEWMYKSMVGIATDPTKPGFKNILLQPQIDPTGKITQASGSHRSPYGKIEAGWKVTADTLSYRTVIPANSRATLRIPTAAPDTVREAGVPLATRPGVTFLGFTDGIATYQLESGSYTLTSTLK